MSPIADRQGTSRGPKPKPKWTVMVFMGADTEVGNAPMLDAARADLAEMWSVKPGGRLNLFVQVHYGRGAPQRSHVGISALRDVPAGQQDPARGQALLHFIAWALEEANRRLPEYSEHYSMLVLWGHAYEFAIGHAPTRQGTIDALDFAELSKVLESLQERFGSPGGPPPKLDILGFDACDLATVEMAYQLSPFAHYLLGSQIGIPIPGWPYDRILRRLRFPIGRRLMGPAEFGSFIVRRYCESYTALRTVSLTLLDLKRTSELVDRTDVLSLMLARAIGRDADTRDEIAFLFSQSQTAADKPYVDVADLCLNLIRHSGEPLVIEAARALGDFLISPQQEVVHGSVDGLGKPFVVEHGRNAGQSARLNGISLYAPHVAPVTDSAAVRHLYDNFVFARKYSWSRLVHSLAR